MLTTLSGRRIVDRTGLEGNWEFDISFAVTPESESASLFTVLQERLGLKLQAARLPMPVMTVDHVERPEQD